MDILQSELYEKIKSFTFNDAEFEFSNEAINEMLPNIQAINAGILKDVAVTDIEGNQIIMDTNEYVKRNCEGFKNKISNEINYTDLVNVLNNAETFTELSNFGTFDMAVNYYLED